MVEVGRKPEVLRNATAEGRLLLQPGTIAEIRAGTTKKGDPIATARVAAIQAVKETPRLLPLCHPIPITGVETALTVEDDGVTATVTVSAVYRTGVEMEALTAVSTALLTVWDMTKYLEKDAGGQYPSTRIENLHVVEKVKVTE
ncbi:MAG: cyclic pyranopterin monophosphate synthase MoaC [Gammaproteobacteria bacterium]|nr:cyclic pyranopterin monophosphate synthase MoaC [Gammaproteobacteria bacterium]